MPHIFSKEELKEKRRQIRHLNSIGEGLNNKDTFLDLAELEQFMKRAHDGLLTEWGQGKDRRQNELLLYLEKAQEAFRLLRDGADDKAGGFGRQELVGALDKLDKLLDVGIGGIGTEAVAAASAEAQLPLQLRQSRTTPQTRTPPPPTARRR